MTSSQHDQDNSPGSGVFDVSELAKVIGDDPNSLKEFTNNYRQTLTEHHAKILQALAESDWEATGILAHRLKSSSRAMGALNLGDCCERIERNGKNSNTSEIDSLKDEFDDLVSTVLYAIDQYL